MEIIEREFNNARQKGLSIGKNAADEAKHLNISSPYLSRLRNERVPLTQEVIQKIIVAFDDYSDSEQLHAELNELITKQTHSYKIASENSVFDESGKYTMEKAEEMFEKLSGEKSLLCVDYRDFPQANEDGAYPELAIKAGKAVKNGLCLALFQPFGNLDNLYLMKDKFEECERENSSKNFELSIRAKRFKKSYLYLIELASEVREVYKRMKKSAGGDSENRIVLYESANPCPNITGIGIQSRLFLANYYDGQQRFDKIFEWIAVEGNKHYFFERWDKSISATALYAQFNPIPTYWENNDRKLPTTKKELETAYTNFGLDSILGKQNVKEMKWEIWTEK